MAKKKKQTLTRCLMDDVAERVGCYFDEAAAARIVDFFEQRLIHSKGQWAGKPFLLQDWQRDLLRRLFGWRRADGGRRFSTAYIELPKKNGKSTLAAGIALYLLLADQEAGAEVYSAAADRQQAAIVFKEALSMVRASPALSSRCKLVESASRIVFERNRSYYQVLSNDVKGKDGINASAIVFDELHTQPNRKLWDALRYAGAARRQPLLLSITTAGYDRHSICYEQHQYAKNVESGMIEDVSFFGFIAAADDGDDWTDETVWKKANPSLGTTITAESFRRDFAEAFNEPAKQNAFKRLRLNIWTEQQNRWIDPRVWAELPEPPPLDFLAGLECWGGLDLASTTDLSALALAFNLPDGTVAVYAWFWAPAEGAAKREIRDRVPYRQWAEAGKIELTPGSRTDYGRIEAKIEELFTRFQINDIAFDPWNASQLAGRLSDFGATMAQFPQTMKNFNEPTREFSNRIANRTLRPDKNPVLAWNAANVEVRTDSTGCIRPVKPDDGQSLRVDGMVASIMALARLMEGAKNAYAGEVFAV